MGHFIVQIVIIGITLLLLLAVEVYRYSNRKVTRLLLSHFGPQCAPALGYQSAPESAELTNTCEEDRRSINISGTLR